jgi:predicted permease
MDLGLQGYSDERGVAFYDQLLEKAWALPGVEAATLTRYMPLGLNNGRRGTTIEGYTRQPGEDLEFHFSVIGPGYFRCLGISVLRGREFTAQDRMGAPRVAMVNETFARRFWPDQDPLGKRLSIEGPEGNFMEIVGVVKDGKYNTLGEDPLPWFATPIGQTYVSDMVLVLRTRGNVKPVVNGATAAIQALDKALPVTVSTVEQHLGVTLLLPRAGAALLGGFGGLGLLLAAVGLAGMMAYVVAQRTHEIGIRMALGATRTDVLGLVLAQGMKLTLIGGALGMTVALGVTRLLRSLLYNVSPADPVTFAGVALVLAGVAFAATYIPARRATRVDRVMALRHE